MQENTTLRKCFQTLYKKALADVRSELRESGGLTSRQAEDIFQKYINRFERFYSKLEIEPFTNEMVAQIFTEYHQMIERSPRTITKRFEEPFSDGTVSIYGYSEDAINEKLKVLVNREKKIRDLLEKIN